MTAPRRLLALSIGALAIAVAAVVLAGGPRVVLLGRSAKDETVVRIQDELRLLGLEVEFHADGAEPRDLAAVARAHNAAAVARVEQQPPEILVWVDPAVAGGGAAAEIRVSATAGGSSDPALLALRAIELLRGRLIPVPVTDRSDASDATTTARSESMDAGAAASDDAAAPRPPAVARPVAPPHREPPRTGPDEASTPDTYRAGAIGLAPALLVSPGVPPMLAVRVGAVWNATPRIAFEAMTSIPTWAATVDGTEGSMDLRVLLAGGGLELGLTEPRQPFGLIAGAGLAAAALFYDGEATAPWMGASGSRWAAAPFASLGARYTLRPALALRGDVLAALLRPEPVLRIAGREIASVGEPAMIVSLGLEVRP